MVARLHGCTAGCLLGITPFPGSLCWVLRNPNVPVRAPHSLPPLHKIRQSSPLCHASAHSTQHTAQHNGFLVESAWC
jgi:hypothetical protein